MTKAHEEGSAWLDVEGFSKAELEQLAQWLATHPHSFMRLEGHHSLETDCLGIIQQLQTQMEINSNRYRDRASPKECARFACLAYQKSWKELPENWKLLTDKNGQPIQVRNSSGYAAVAFVNHHTRNVVIAHTGTEPPQEYSLNAVQELIKDLSADFNEVASRKLGQQQQSAINFSETVHKRVDGHHYTIGCVGHSLGGWLAQLSAFHLAQKYANQKQHVYAVCLDSPGAKEMIDQYYRLKYSLKKRVDLDVTNYVLLPNHVNTLGTHLGVVCQVFSKDLLKINNLESNTGKYLLFTHDKWNIENAFVGPDEEPPFSLRVENWPSVSWKAVNWANNKWAELPRLILESTLAPMRVILDAVGMASSTYKDLQSFKKQYQDCVHHMLGEELDEFNLLYKSSYKAEPDRKNSMSQDNLSGSAKHLLSQIHSLRQIHAGYPDERDTIEAFLREKAKNTKLSGDDLSILCAFLVDGKTIKTEISAPLFRRKIESLLRCNPTLETEIVLSDFIGFLSQTYPFLGDKAIIGKGCMGCPTLPKQVIVRTLLAEIDMHFDGGNKIVNLSGETGAGKTTLAGYYGQEFAKRDSNKTCTFFIDASCTKSLERSWRELASKLGISRTQGEMNSVRDLIKPVYDRLSTLNSYLLIFDDAEESASDYIQPSSKGKILLTSKTGTHLPFDGQVYLDVTRYPLQFEQLLSLSDSDTNLKQLHSQTKAALQQSPLAATLLFRYLESASTQEKQRVITALNQSSNRNVLNKVVSLVLRQACAKLNCLDANGEMKNEPLILALLPFFYWRNAPDRFVTDWWTSSQVRALSKNAPLRYDPIHELVTTVLTERGEMHQGTITAIKEILDFAERDYAFPFLQFLSKKITMDNIAYDEFKRNAGLSVLAENLLPRFQEANGLPSDKTTLFLLTSILNSVANNKLHTRQLEEGKQYFELVKQMCEASIGVFPSTSKLDESKDADFIEKLNAVDPRLVLSYTKALHYLGKISFQTAKTDKFSDLKANDYFYSAVRLFEKWKDNPLTKQNMSDTEFREDIRVNAIIFQRQGLGWLLNESNNPADWDAAKQLYIKLYDEEAHPFNQYYCNMQLGKIYFKLAQQLSQKRETQTHYYQKAMERLKDGGAHKKCPYPGALTLAINQNNVLWKMETYFSIGSILADQNNPSFDFKKSEENFMKVIEIAENKGQTGLDYIFCAYYGLAKLHASHANSHFSESNQSQVKAQWYANLALRQLTHSDDIASKRQKEIGELEELLKNINSKT